MINWDEFEHIHVIKKLKQILGAWWGLDVIFTDERGHIKGFDSGKQSFHNPGIAHLMKQDTVKTQIGDLVCKAIENLRVSNNRYILQNWNHTGFDIGIFPVLIENDFVGTVVTMGFYKDMTTNERLMDVRSKLSLAGMSTDMIEKTMSKVQYIDDTNKGHFVELCELVAQEIVTLHLEITSRENQIKELNKELGNRFKYDNMIGKSKPMQQLYTLLDKIKTADSTVLIQGENGTGKELIARSIHYNSLRKDKAFITLNSAGLQDTLLETELFGHVKGSFTGALKDKKGLFESADKGTFFLDEIGDTTPAMQVKLLRVLQEGTFTPVGATDIRKVDVRVIAATNKNLKEMVEQGTFREDLYYRLNVINIRVPPLRERKEDIPVLVDYFMMKLAEKNPGIKKQLTKRALEKFFDYHWPGNIRELENELEHLWVVSDDKLQAESLSARILESGDKNKVQGARLQGKLKDALESLERDMIREGLRRTGWNKSKLAKELGISRAGLIMKVEKYELDKRKMTRG